MRFVKGHGTENDFVILPDSGERLDAALVRALCDRRRGIGADGVLAVTRAEGHYFMDYRNADGSIAETCGNGIRVFARYLVSEGLAEPGSMVIGTRAGPCRVDVPSGDRDITVEMGTPARLSDAEVSLGSGRWPAYGWSMGNPHLVVLDVGRVDALDLAAAPEVVPSDGFPDGVNVEFVEPAGGQQIRMRVFERGVGETRSCGTGACAAAVAAMDVAGRRATYDVDVPGGRLAVTWRDDGMVTLAGPAVLVASGEVDLDEIRSSARASDASMSEA